MTHRTRDLQVSALARIEGEGALRIVATDGEVTDVQLRIYEPPRFFEAFLRGRQHTEVTDITSRICGICPVAYQASAWQAVESICAVQVDERIAALRRLIYCGEWISSHALHIYLLHAPDFLGYPDVVALAADHRAIVERGLRLKKAGNAVLETIGGRAIHPVNTRVGGFYRAPLKTELLSLGEILRQALEDAIATTSWVAGFEFPDREIDCDFLAVTKSGEYAIESGTVASARGLTFPAENFPAHVVEHQVPHSTALHATLDGGLFLTGPLARYTINSAALSPVARQAAHAAGLGATCANPYRSIVVRAVETVYAITEALRIIESYERPDPSFVPVPPAAGEGHGVSEAPRGLLYHRYRLDPDGLIESATIVPPTSQNQAAIEADLRRAAEAGLHLPDHELTAVCERTIRNYDPCISCSAHFLKLEVDRQ
jgi:coenzyme F420-reducing hydrogenase alpha subunit